MARKVSPTSADFLPKICPESWRLLFSNQITPILELPRELVSSVNCRGRYVEVRRCFVGVGSLIAHTKLFYLVETGKKTDMTEVGHLPHEVNKNWLYHSANNVKQSTSNSCVPLKLFRSASTDLQVRTTLYSIINSTTGKYCSVAFT